MNENKKDQRAREARTKAYDLTSLAASINLYGDFTDVFEELYPILIDLGLETDKGIFVNEFEAVCETYQKAQMGKVSRIVYLSHARVFSGSVLAKVLESFPYFPSEEP